MDLHVVTPLHPRIPLPPRSLRVDPAMLPSVECDHFLSWMIRNQRWPRVSKGDAVENRWATWVDEALALPAGQPTRRRVEALLSNYTRPKAGRPRKGSGYVIPVVEKGVWITWEESWAVLKEFYANFGRLPRTSASSLTSPAEVAWGVRLRRLTSPSSAHYRPEIREWAEGIRQKLLRSGTSRLTSNLKGCNVRASAERLVELEQWILTNNRRPSSTSDDIVESSIAVWYLNWLRYHKDQPDHPVSVRINAAILPHAALRRGAKGSAPTRALPDQINFVRVTLAGLKNKQASRDFESILSALLPTN